MDLIKIGKYIAEKRKGLGLTQRQLAEKIGMSDKSVSKWERGICLPDVSVYMELCDILGISINEFLAGEDISEENIIKKSEDNLIQMTKDSKYKQRHLKRIILVLIILTIAAGVSLGAAIYQNLRQPQNYITAVEQDSAEMKTAELLSGADGAFLYKYSTGDEFTALTVYMSEYRSGKLITKNKVADLAYEDIDSASEGMIVLVPDFEEFLVKLIVTDNYSKYSTAVPILENVENREYYGRSATQIEEDTPIKYDTEQGLLALIYGKNGLRRIPVQEMENGEFETMNDYVYYFSFQFDK